MVNKFFLKNVKLNNTFVQVSNLACCRDEKRMIKRREKIIVRKDHSITAHLLVVTNYYDVYYNKSLSKDLSISCIEYSVISFTTCIKIASALTKLLQKYIYL